MHSHASDPALGVLGGGQGHVELVLPPALHLPGLDEAVVGGSHQAQAPPGRPVVRILLLLSYDFEAPETNRAMCTA